MRERIELSGRDARWEFPKGPLFGRTNYMAEICGALAEMVEVVDDFFKFLGPELKAVTGEGGSCPGGPSARGARRRPRCPPRSHCLLAKALGARKPIQ